MQGFTSVDDIGVYEAGTSFTGQQIYAFEVGVRKPQMSFVVLQAAGCGLPF